MFSDTASGHRSGPLWRGRAVVAESLAVSVAGLVAVAVGHELVIADPHGQVSVALSLVLFGGPLLYLLSQTVYLWAILGIRSLPRLAALAALAVAGGLSQLLPAYAALGLVAAVLLVLVVTLIQERDATSSRLPMRRPA